MGMKMSATVETPREDEETLELQNIPKDVVP